MIDADHIDAHPLDAQARRGRRAQQSGSTARRWRGTSGASDALGLALIAPAAIGLALVILFLSRQVDSRATAQSAAEAAAQAAAQERSPAAAVAAARSVTDAMLIDETTCDNPSVRVDVSAFAAPVEPFVSVEVSCSTSLAGLEPIGASAPAAHTYVAYATVDPLRGVRP